MFNPSRQDARGIFFETWRKYRAQEALAGIETLILEVVLQHPEYHALLAQPEQYMDRDYLPEQGETNPFLHMSMHLALAEQLSIDQPPGIRTRHAALLSHTADAHAAQHEVMECLVEMIWQAQRNHAAPDAAIYLACLDKKLAQ
jgi:hypothetical protein